MFFWPRSLILDTLILKTRGQVGIRKFTKYSHMCFGSLYPDLEPKYAADAFFRFQEVFFGFSDEKPLLSP